MLTSISVPNLVSGVSQQPPPLRLSTSVEDSVNQWPSVVSGLSPRFGTLHIADLGLEVPSGAVAHLIDRGDGYRFIVVATPGDLKVFNLEGVEQTVAFPQWKAYLDVGGDATNQFRFLTIEDYTFILNRNVIVGKEDIGESGSLVDSPDGTAADFGSLPTASVTYANQVYQTTDSGYYYMCKLTGGSDQIISWENTATSGPTWEPESYDGTALPPNPTLGQVFKLRVDATGTDNPFSGSDAYYYYTYEGVETQAASSPSYSWVRVRSWEWNTTDNGRVNWRGVATVHIVNSVSNARYSIYINGSLAATHLTHNGTDAANSLEGTDVIAEELETNLSGGGYTVTRYGSTLSILVDSTDTITIATTNGDKAMKCYREAVQAFADLPPNEMEGRIVKVKGAPEEQQDDYFVIFQDGRWIETFAYGALTELSANTMPHVLVKEADGTFTFKQHTWTKRSAGDADSNPPPSFVGYPISDVFQYTNRIGFLTKDNVILSESNEYENFFRTTIATLLDSDPIDMSVLSPVNDSMRHVVQFNKDLMIFGDMSQQRMNFQQLVGPKNVQVNLTTVYNCSPNVHPINMGSSVYFVDDRPSYTHCKVFEYFPKANTTADEAQDVTDPVPTYISSGVKMLAASPRLSLAAIITAGNPDSIFIHKFYWSGDKKLQNSWCKWTFAECTNVVWVGFSGNYMHILLVRNGSLYLERIEVSEDVTNRIILDRRVDQSSLVMDYADGFTEVTLPYPTNEVPACVSITQDGKRIVHKVDMLENGHLSVAWDLTEDETVWVGLNVDSSVTLSRPYVRFQKGNGEVVTEESPLFVRDIRLSFANLERMDAELRVRSVTYNKTISYTASVDTGSILLPIVSTNHDFELTLRSDWPLSYQLTSAEWRAEFSPKSRRV